MKQGRLATGDQREFVVSAWDGHNHSGYDPLDDKVIVLMDEHAAQTMIGVIMPDQYVDRQSQGAETGTIVALGPAAFAYDDEVRRKWIGRKPEPGDRVYVTRYSGQLLQGVDGRVYRLMSQHCIGAVAQPEALARMIEAQREIAE